MAWAAFDRQRNRALSFVSLVSSSQHLHPWILHLHPCAAWAPQRH